MRAGGALAGSLGIGRPFSGSFGGWRVRSGACAAASSWPALPVFPARGAASFGMRSCANFLERTAGGLWGLGSVKILVVEIIQQHSQAGECFLIFTKAVEQGKEALHALSLQPVALA